ncbi:hypothetical protein BLOT_013915 [Blomia tropicalis]|nr:hypothetical protein BLOT_013915 [Blomia tropicalis]
MSKSYGSMNSNVYIQMKTDNFNFSNEFIDYSIFFNETKYEVIIYGSTKRNKFSCEPEMSLVHRDELRLNLANQYYH